MCDLPVNNWMIIYEIEAKNNAERIDQTTATGAGFYN